GPVKLARRTRRRLFMLESMADALNSRRNGSFLWLRLAAGETRKLAATVGAVWRSLLRRAGQS
ncbi:MAG TPA: hypothetical protein VML36_09065, partial [Nitrospiria bacterium]|nr:hypothetical protein [Nitrospiria bacterium]